MKKTVLSLCAAAAVLAAGELKTHTELSFVDTSGNTDTTSAAFELKASKTWEKHELNFHADAYYSEDSNVESKNKWSTEIIYDYPAEATLAFEYLVGYKEDKFSSHDYQFYTGPGLRYKAIASEAHMLNLSGIILYASDKLQTGKSEDYAAYKASLEYAWKVSELLKFKQEAAMRGSMEEGDNYFLYSKTAIENKLSDVFSLGVSYKVDYTNQPAADKVKSDRTLLISLIADF